MTLAITQLRLSYFRCYQDINLHLDDRAVVLTGSNGAGKTNILEALSFLSPGRGLRNAKIEDIRQNTAKDESWAISFIAETPSGTIQIGTGEDRQNNRRVVKIEGDAQKSQTALTEYCSVVWVTPQMDRLFLDGSSIRRRFLDQVIFNFEPTHLGRLNKYDKVMRERSRLLRDYGVNGADKIWLNSLEVTIAETALSIAAARLTMVERLQKACIENHHNTNIFPLPSISIDGWVENELQNNSALDVEDSFREMLKNNRERDAIVGGSEHGTHRSDFVVWHKEHNMIASQCSTGEQKGLLMAITLAHARLVKAERGFAPLLLLDEMIAHLDEGRRQTLFDMVLSLGGQCWMTGTDRNMFEPLKNKAQFLSVENACINKPKLEVA